MTKRLVQNLLHKELSYQIHGAAIEVRKDFGPGHKEKLYQNALAKEPERRKISFEKEKAIKIYSPKDGNYIGLYRPDFVVDDKIIVELKAEKFVSKDEIKRIYDYLRNGKYELAYFINFASPRLFVRRIIYTNDYKPFNNPPRGANTKLINTKNILASIGLLLVLFSGLPSIARAASLYFSPSSGEYAVGKTFSVGVYVSSADQAMNAASGVISFPRDKLEVVSLSKTGSIFTLWVQEPSFSNSAGTVNFEGIVLNPGFIGASGKAVTITFRTKAAGNAPLTFSSGSALANDGKGTNILTGLGDANFSIGTVRPGAPEIVMPAEIAGTPDAPAISSLTHPNPNKWYIESDAKFNWNMPQDITALRLLVGRISNAIPTTTYTSPINSKEVVDLDDGIWYFSVRLRNNAGWGAVSRFRFQIDTEKPTRFEITEVRRTDLTEPTAKFIFNASDKTSGIDHYEIQIDNGSPQIWQDDGSHKYETPTLVPGKYTLIAKAVDMASNTLANSVEFIIEALEAPVIIEWPRELQSSEQLIVKGSSNYPNAQIFVWLQQEGKDAKSQGAQSDENGNFIFVADEKLTDGAYKLWAKVVDRRGAQSNPSDTVIIAVGRSAFLKLGSWAVSLLAVVVPLVALILLLAYLLWYWWHKFATLRKRAKKEIREAEQALHKAFYLLKEAIREQIKLLEKTKTKRQLTEEEEKIVKQLRKDIDDAEKFVRKEIEDIEKEIK